MDKDHVETNLLYFKVYWNSRNTTVYHTLHIQTHPVITQFLQPEAEQLLLFRILLASVVLTTSFLKHSVTCSWRLQLNKYRYESEILKCSSNVHHTWHKILTPCTQCSWRWLQFRIQFFIHGTTLRSLFCIIFIIILFDNAIHVQCHSNKEYYYYYNKHFIIWSSAVTFQFKALTLNPMCLVRHNYSNCSSFLV